MSCRLEHAWQSPQCAIVVVVVVVVIEEEEEEEEEVSLVFLSLDCTSCSDSNVSMVMDGSVLLALCDELSNDIAVVVCNLQSRGVV